MSPGAASVRDLADILPAGEWADIKTIPEEENGLVALEDWGLLGRARSLRAQGRNVFLKWFRPAPEGASEATARFTGATRLERVEARLVSLTRSDAKPYLVEVIEVAKYAKGLLIVMAEVVPLSKLIDSGAVASGKGSELAIAILRDLDPAKFSGAWMHFDICPRNIGLKPDNSCVLIDLESGYLAVESVFPVRTPACKWFRLPLAMNEALQSQIDTAKISKTTAVRKMQQEVLLSAAECALGWFVSASEVATREELTAWLSSAPVDPRISGFFKARIFDAYFSDAPISLATVLEGLRAVLVELTGSVAPKVLAELVPVPELTRPADIPPERVRVPEVKKPVQERREPGDRWQSAWEAVVPHAKKLRGDRLGRAGLEDYYRRLDALRVSFPGQREIYDEMLLVAITYRRDPALAGSVVDAALGQFRGDAAFLRWKRIIDAWRLDRSHE